MQSTNSKFAYQTDRNRVLTHNTNSDEIIASKVAKVKLLDGEEKSITVFFSTTPDSLEKLAHNAENKINSTRETIGAFKKLCRDQGISEFVIIKGLNQIHNSANSEVSKRKEASFKQKVPEKSFDQKNTSSSGKNLMRTSSVKALKEKSAVLNAKAQDILDFISDNIAIPVATFENLAKGAIKNGAMVRVDSGNEAYTWTPPERKGPAVTEGKRRVAGTVTQAQPLSDSPPSSTFALHKNKPLPARPGQAETAKPAIRQAKPLPAATTTTTTATTTTTTTDATVIPHTFTTTTTQPVKLSTDSATDIDLPDLSE